MIRIAETTTEILAEIMRNDHLPTRADGTAISDHERAHVKAALVEKANFEPEHVFTVCVACGTRVAFLASAPCRCGGFVCGPCAASEEDGVCHHEPPIELGLDADVE